MKRFGLAAILTFVDKGASAAMGRIGARAAKLKKQFKGIGDGVRQAGKGFGTLATAALPLTGVLGLAIKKGAEFEQEIARLQSKMLGGFDPALKSLAKTLGATTAFSASQAAEAMTNLATAGFDAKEIQAAIRPVLNAAAAEGISLADAADIVASAMRGMKVPAAQAAKAAGTMALASTKANTTMLELKEGLKLAAPAASQIGAKLADVVAVLGATSDIGVKATSAGTAFRAALQRLVKPTKEVRKGLAQAGISIGQVQKFIDKGDVVGLFGAIAKNLGSMRKASVRAAVASKIFGIRGAAIGSALSKSKKDTDKFLNTLAALRAESGKTAERMKDIQLNTLIGQGKLAASALEGISLELFKLIGTETRSLARGLVKTLSDLALAMRVVGGEKITDPETQRELKGVSKTIFEVARGIKLGIGEAKAVLRGVFSTLGDIGKKFGLTFGEGGAKNIAKLVTKFAALAAVLAPVALGLLGITKVAGGMKDVVVGGLKATVGAGRAAASTLGGVAGLLGKRLPFLGKIFGGIGGFVGKAARAAEKITAQPVRVVNFDESGGLGGVGSLLGGGLPSGARNIDLATGQTVGTLARFRAALASGVGRLGRFGSFLNSGALSVAGATSKVGRVLAGAGKFGLVGAAGAAGFALGRLIDRTFGLSDKISNFVFNLKERITGAAEARKRRVAEFGRQVALKNAQEMANQLARLSQRGVSTVGVGGGKREALTAAFAEKRITEFLKKQNFTSDQINRTLSGLTSTLRGIRTGGAKATAKPMKPAKDAFVSTGGLLPVSAGDVVLDRASLAGAVVSQLRGGLAGRAGAGALGGGDPGRAAPPPAPSIGPLRIEVPVTIDGRQIALAVAQVRLDDLERSGRSVSPDQRKSLLQRGFMAGA